ncbi:MAG: ABC transporter ATP-binding protein, partial [Thermoplasmata archaeon]
MKESLSSEKKWEIFFTIVKRSIRIYRREIVLLISLWVLLLALGAIVPFLTRNVIDTITYAPFSYLVQVILAIIIIATILHIINKYLEYRFQMLKAKGRKDLWADCYTAIQQREIKEIKSGEPTGVILSKILSDTEMTADLMCGCFISLVVNAMKLVTAIIIISLMSLHIIAIILLTVPLFYILMRKFAIILLESSEKERIVFSNVNESLREKLEGLITIKEMVKEKFFSSKFRNDCNEWFTAKRKIVFASQLFEGLFLLIIVLAPKIVLGIGVLLVVYGLTTIGTIVAIILIVENFYESLANIIGTYSAIHQYIPPAERVLKMLETPGTRWNGKMEVHRIENLKFENVYFKYKDNPILVGFTMSISAGECVAIVGESGAGKSTIVNLILGHDIPYGGRISINGRNLNEYNITTVRRKIKVVRQGDFLFNLSIRENITLGEEVSKDVFASLTKIAQLEEFVPFLTEGYNTVVGDRGVKLSDGQKQRVAIARALLQYPDVLIIDEGTSAID